MKTGRSMLLKEIMSTRVVTVDMDDTLKVVKEIFDNTKFHHILVLEDDRLFGVISDRDLYRSISHNIGTAAETKKDSDTLFKKAHQIMSRLPITLGPENNVDDAIEVFNRNIISCIPIVEEQDKVVGIISWRDIFKAIEADNGFSLTQH
jgi:acetoin utilization protein AcuB